MRRRGRPWSQRRWRKFYEKRDKQIALEIRRDEEAAALAEYESEMRQAALAKEFAQIAKATNQLVTPFDDSPMGEAHLEVREPGRVRMRRKQRPSDVREVREDQDICVQGADHVLAWWHR